MKKCDYLKGITAGIALRGRMPARYTDGAYALTTLYVREVDAAIRKLEDKYRDALGANDSLGLPARESEAWERAGRYREGVRHGLEYGKPTVFVVCRFNGNGSYNYESLAEHVIYSDPALASVRAWELDPNGERFTSLDIGYVRGASVALGVE